MADPRRFIEPRASGGYSVSKPRAQRASALVGTQGDGIEWTKVRGLTPVPARVRTTKNGSPNQFRKA
jgi:hypothetical protein